MQIKHFIFFLLMIQFALFGNEFISPVGYWKTIDDQTGRIKSIVKITEENGELAGIVKEIFPELGNNQNPTCKNCKGINKNKEVRGITFLWGFQKNGEKYEEGKILDPQTGKIYNCMLEVSGDGSLLYVRGFIKLFVKIGRKQTWIRISEEDPSI